MADFTSTYKANGDNATMDAIITGSITELADGVSPTIGDSAFRGCAALAKADFLKVTEIGNNAFRECAALVTLILRSETMADLWNSMVFNDTPIASGTGYIYVPSALAATYKADATWGKHSAQIRAIEDYPAICGEVS